MTFKKLLKPFLSIFIIILLSSCSNKTDTPTNNTTNLQSLFQEHPQNKNRLYGIGIGDTTTDAVDNALIDCISKIAIEVNSETIYKATTEPYSKIFVTKTLQEVKKVFAADYTIENMQSIETKRAVQISLSKEDFIDTLTLMIESEKNEIEEFDDNTLSSKGILTRIKKLEDMLEHTKKIDYLVSMLEALKYHYTYSSETEKYTKILNNHYAKLKIHYRSDMNPQKFPKLKELKEKIDDAIKDTLHRDTAPYLWHGIHIKTRRVSFDNTVVFSMDDCTEAYRAIRGNGWFWQSYGVDVYQGCIKITIFDSGKRIYYKRIEGKKMGDYGTFLQAGIKSYESEKTQQGIDDMLHDLSKHKTLRYIMKSEK